MNKPLNASGGYDDRNKKTHIRFLIFTFAWVLTLVLADKAELYEWHSSLLLSMIGIIINTGIGLGMVWSFIQLLKELDELQRKIQLNALAISAGVAIVGGTTFSLLATANIIIDAEATDVILLIALTYMAGTIIGNLRYR